MTDHGNLNIVGETADDNPNIWEVGAAVVIGRATSGGHVAAICHDVWVEISSDLHIGVVIVWVVIDGVVIDGAEICCNLNIEEVGYSLGLLGNWKVEYTHY